MVQRRSEERKEKNRSRRRTYQKRFLAKLLVLTLLVTMTQWNLALDVIAENLLPGASGYATPSDAEYGPDTASPSNAEEKEIQTALFPRTPMTLEELETAAGEALAHETYFDFASFGQPMIPDEEYTDVIDTYGSAFDGYQAFLLFADNGKDGRITAHTDGAYMEVVLRVPEEDYDAYLTAKEEQETDLGEDVLDEGFQAPPLDLFETSDYVFLFVNETDEELKVQVNIEDRYFPAVSLPTYGRLVDYYSGITDDEESNEGLLDLENIPTTASPSNASENDDDADDPIVIRPADETLGNAVESGASVVVVGSENATDAGPGVETTASENAETSAEHTASETAQENDTVIRIAQDDAPAADQNPTETTIEIIPDHNPETAGAAETTPEMKPDNPEAVETTPAANLENAEATESHPKPETPEVTETNPATQPETPETIETTPETKPETPEDTETTPETEPETPGAAETTPEANPENPETTETHPATNPETPGATETAPENDSAATQPETENSTDAGPGVETGAPETEGTATAPTETTPETTPTAPTEAATAPANTADEEEDDIDASDFEIAPPIAMEAGGGFSFFSLFSLLSEDTDTPDNALTKDAGVRMAVVPMALMASGAQIGGIEEYAVESGNYISVSKTFTGLPEDKIPGEFVLHVNSSSGSEYSYDLRYGDGYDFTETKDPVNNVYSWKWQIKAPEAGTYSISESGETVDGYNVERTGLGDNQEVKPAEVTITAAEWIAPNNEAVFNVSLEGTNNNIFIARLTKGAGLVVISEKPIDKDIRSKLEATLNPSDVSKGVEYYSIAEQPGTSFSLAGGTVTYNPDARTMTFSATCAWTHVLTPTIVTTTATSATFNVGNTYEPDDTDIIITKKVTGNLGDRTKQFAFTVTSDQPLKAGDGYTLASDNKEATFSLADGNSVTLKGVKIGSKLTITESGIGSVVENGSIVQHPYDMSWKVTDANGVQCVSDDPAENGEDSVTFEYTVPELKKATDTEENPDAPTYVGPLTITVTNEKEVIVDTGILLDSIPYIVILALALGGIAVYTFRKRKDDESDLD